jgi:hypothetical protein
VNDLDTRAEAELDGLLGQGECAGDQGLGSDDRRDSRQGHHGIKQTGRHQSVEGVKTGPGVVQQQRALAEIVQQKRWVSQAKPGKLDGAAAEMPQVGVKRLSSRDTAPGPRTRNRAVIGLNFT